MTVIRKSGKTPWGITEPIKEEPGCPINTSTGDIAKCSECPWNKECSNHKTES